LYVLLEHDAAKPLVGREHAVLGSRRVDGKPGKVSVWEHANQ